MQATRTAALTAQLKAYLEKTGLTQIALSKELGISAAALSEVMRGKNSPVCETTLHALEILKANQMNDAPKTLHLARERISEMAEEIKQLKSMTARAAAPVAPPPPAPKPPTPPLAPKAPPTATSTMTAWEKEVARASVARLEGLSSKPLAQQTVRELQAALNNAQPDDRAEIYNLLQQRKADARLLNPRARLRGA